VDKQGNLVSQPTLTVEELNAIVDEAHAWGKKVACHAYNGIGMQRALGWRMRFDRTRTGNNGCANRADETAGNVVLPDALAVLQRLGAGEYSGGKA